MSRTPARSHGNRIGTSIAAVREERGWKVPDFGRRLRLIDAPISDESLYKIEYGKRPNISVGQLLMLAYVLDVSPLPLLLPKRADEPIALTPGYYVRAQPAYEWIVGGAPAPARVFHTPGAYTGRPPATPEQQVIRRFAAQADLLMRLPYARQHHEGEQLAIGTDPDGIANMVRFLTNAKRED